MKYKFFLVLYLFSIFSSFIACEFDKPLNDYFEYSFDNRTNQTVTIELKQSYRLQNDIDSIKENKKNNSNYEPPAARTASLNISSGNSQKVFIENHSADFSWKTGSRSDNLEVYCETNGSKATFMTREIEGYFNYEFDNKTRYTIAVTMNRPYKTPYKNSSDRTNVLNINRDSKTTIFVLKNYSVNFSWTASNASDTPKIYSEIIGSIVIFRER